jgi:pimeloyl-ACP methyl ester carboxylesterase
MLPELIACTTADGERIAAALLPPARPDGSLVLVCPGFFKSKNTATFQRLARRLLDPWAVLTMDFRGHGDSSGRFAFSAREAADVAAVLAWARPRYQRIGIVGFSLGAAAAILAAGDEPAQIRSLIAVSAPAAFEDIEFKWWTPEAIRRGLQGLERGVGCRPGHPWAKKVRPLDRIGALAGVPVLVLHGTHDVIVGLRHSERLFEAAAQPKQFDVIAGGSHAEAMFRDDPEGFGARLRSWFERTLRDGAP